MHELSPTDILRRVKDICKTAKTIFACGLEQNSRDRSAPTVNHLALAKVSVHSSIYFLSRHTFLADIYMPYSTYPLYRYIYCFCSGSLPTTFLLCRNSAYRT
jgi:hypothetical protein